MLDSGQHDGGNETSKLVVATESPGDDDASALENCPYFSNCYKMQKDHTVPLVNLRVFPVLLWSLKLKSFCTAEESMNTIFTAYRTAENLCQLYWRQRVNI